MKNPDLQLPVKSIEAEWGLVWNATLETGGLMVSDEVTISCEVELINSG